MSRLVPGIFISALLFIMSFSTPKQERTFINVLSSDGTWRKGVKEGTPKAERRDYELKDGRKGTKFELVYSKFEGIITNVGIYEGDLFRSLHISLRSEEHTS